MEKSSSQLRKEFLQNYTKILVPFLKNYEEKRKIALITWYVAIALSVIAAIVVLVLLKGKPPILMLVAAAIVGAVGYGITLNIKTKYNKDLKKGLMPLICQCVENLTYETGDYKNKNLFASARVFGKQYSMAKLDSVFYGSRGDTKFELFEGAFINTVNKKETIFQGVIIRLKLYKKIDSHTVVYKNNLINTPFTYDLKRISIDNVNFEEKSSVYTNDVYVAKHLINTELTTFLKTVSKAFSAKIYSCAFCKDDFFLVLETQQHLFPVNELNKSLIDDNGFFILLDDFITVYKLIDYFKDNVNLGPWVILPPPDEK